MSQWTLVFEGYDPEREGHREALCTLGNGRFATRGAAPDCAADDVHYPGTYVAGGYDRATTEIAGREVENEDLVNFPNWLPLTFRPEGGDWVRLDDVEVLSFRQALELERGVLVRELRVRDADRRTTRWTERRLVSMADPHIAALSVEIRPEDWEGALEVRSAIDGEVENAGVPRYQALEGRHVEVLHAEPTPEGTLLLCSRTRQSRLEVAQAARTRLYRDDRRFRAEPRVEAGAVRVVEVFSAEISPAAPLCVEKVVALHTARDRAITEPCVDARARVERAPRFDALLAAHERAWKQLWEEFDLTVVVDDGGPSQLHLRLHVFHLLQTASPHTTELDVGVPARGWHGEAYRGHIFWDELFVFPLLDLRLPNLTRALLRYRHRRLPEARRAARAAGFEGAMYPWQSGSTGREETQELHLNPKSGNWIPDTSHRQRHIGSAVAFNVWHHYQVTQDLDFLITYGAEVILEIARFWASIARYDETRDRYSIRGVMGPDEYHTAPPGADPEAEGGLVDNAYTNVMAAWVLSRARDVADVLPADDRRRLFERIGLEPAALDHWEDVSRKLRVCFHGDGIISQFDGYGDLEDVDWEGLRAEHGDVQRLDRVLEAEGDDPNRYKASKQADVLMLFYLFSADELRMLFEQLGYAFDPQLIPRNIDYYLARTSHGSSLSRIVHAWVLARSDRPASWDLFRDALETDVADVQGGTTREGIHTGAMAGTIDLMHRCYTGLEIRTGVLRFDPMLPEAVSCVRLRIRFRRHVLDVEVTRDLLAVESRLFSVPPITIAYRGHHRVLSPGERHTFRLLTPQERARERRDEDE